MSSVINEKFKLEQPLLFFLLATEFGSGLHTRYMLIKCAALEIQLISTKFYKNERGTTNN